MIRVVADANVLISAALARSPTAPSVAGARRGARRPHRARQLVSSPSLLAEITSVLARARLRRYLSLDEAERFVADLASQTALSSDAPRPHPAICRDPGDDYLIALALHAGAEGIVTGDRDLLEIADPPVAVLTPRALVERLSADG